MNTNIKLIVADLDGTLLSDDKTICQQNLQAIEDLKKAGIIFTVATGRSFIMAQRYFDQLVLGTLVATYNGGLIHNLSLQRDVDIRNFDPKTVQKMVDFASERVEEFFVYTRDCLYVNLKSEHIKRFYDYNESVKQQANQKMLPIYPLEDFLNATERKPVLKFGIQNENIPELLTWFSELQQYPQFYIVNSMPSFLEIMPQGVSKGRAVHDFAKFYNVPVQNIAVFGDEANDIAMFETAGFSFVMDNARDEIKKYANYIVSANNDAGFADGVWNYIL